jgi:hypothetical protein
MKITRFLFASLFVAGLMPEAGFGYSFAQVVQEASSRNAETATSTAADGQKEAQAPNGKTQASGNPDGKSTTSKSISKTKIKRGPIVSPAKPAPIHRQARSANAPMANNLPPAATENALHSQTAPSTAASNTSAAIPHKTQSYQQSYQKTSASASAFSINGERFKNSRQPGARLAINGGPSGSTHGAAAINGSDMKRKP